MPCIHTTPLDWGEGGGEAPLGRHGSLWVAAGDAGRECDIGEKSYKITLLAAMALRAA